MTQTRICVVSSEDVEQQLRQVKGIACERRPFEGRAEWFLVVAASGGQWDKIYEIARDAGHALKWIEEPEPDGPEGTLFRDLRSLTGR